MKELMDFLREYDIKMVVSMIVIMWYFTRDLKTSIDRLDEDVKKMNTRLCSLEETVYGKDIYMKIED